MELFTDRYAAGKLLAQALVQYQKNSNAIVLALPRGGVPVAHEVAKALSLPLDLLIVRKLGVPWQEELAMGAIAMGDTIVYNEELLQNLRIDASALKEVIEKEKTELHRREQLYRQNQPLPVLTNKIILLIDDGIATGATMRAAVAALRTFHPTKIVIAVPVAAPETCEEMEKIADQVICLLKPAGFYAVGQWYKSFLQTDDEEVFALLKQHFA
jgi:putative phosphoribosyl transferase